MKNLYIIGMFVAAGVLSGSCNDEWEDELYSHMASFKAPVGSDGVYNIYMRYQPDGTASYDLPVIISGTTDNSRDLDIQIAVDNDTLRHLNSEKFAASREDLFFRQLDEKHYSFESGTCHIPAGANTEIYPIHFQRLDELDMMEKWVLPLTVVGDPSYELNLYKGRYKALLRINLFNDYSGTYTASGMNVYIDGTSTEPATEDTRVAYVKDERSIFFYAGTIWDEDFYRKNYKVVATFGEGTADEDGSLSGEITLSAGDPESQMELEMTGDCTYRKQVLAHATKPYLERHITTLYLDYKYTDYTSSDTPMRYYVTGTMTMERDINILIPDEDQAIQW